MKPTLNQRRTALTRTELLLVIAVIIVLASMLLPTIKAKPEASRIGCLINLKEIGTAYRLWAGDNGDLVPAQQTVSKGGGISSPMPIKAQTVG